MSTQVEERPDVVRQTDNGDHEMFAHYVLGKPGATTEAYVLGTPLEALCGKRWVPTRDPKRYPICPECVEIHDGMATA